MHGYLHMIRYVQLVKSIRTADATVDDTKGLDNT